MEIIKIIINILLIVLVIYLIYVILSCTIPYLLPVKVSEATKADTDSAEFYGNEINENERIALIEEPADAMNVRMSMIRSAEKSLDIAYHNLQTGDTTLAFIGELYRAADRGVTVRLIIDGKIGDGEKEAKHGLSLLASHPNVEVKGYNPLNLLKPWEWPVVFHDKFIIADDKMLLLGGRNIGDRYYAPKGYDKPVTNDRDVFIALTDGYFSDSSSVKQTDDYMALLWNSDYCKEVWEPMTDDKKKDKYKDIVLTAAEQIERDNPKFYDKSIHDYIEETVPTNKITLIHNPIKPVKTEPTLGYKLKQLALSAKDNVKVQTPYCTADRDLLDAMKEVDDSSSLTLLTNSPASTPNLIAFSNYFSQREKFIDTGAEIHELQSRDSIHGKSMSLDERIAVVGSFNMDDRSFYIDTETMLVIDSPEFTKILNDAMNVYSDTSLIVGTDNKYIHDADIKEEPVPFSRKIMLLLITPVSRMFQFLI